MASNTKTQSLLAQKVTQANARREALRRKGTQNVQPTNYYNPTVEQAEDLLAALIADADWSNEKAQEESSADTYFVFRKRNLGADEQPTIIRAGYSLDFDALILTITGEALPEGFSLDGVVVHDGIAAAKETAKRKAIAKADAQRAAFQARLGF